MHALRSTRLETPLGPVSLLASDAHLIGVYLPEDPRGAKAIAGALEDDGHPILAAAREQLQAYFAGERTCFLLPLSFSGTAFQERVWRALVEIPFGETRSYGALAKGLSSVARAVGTANGQNPLAIVVPCHRVVGADGSLTGYAGGLAAKRWLLAHEAGLRREDAGAHDDGGGAKQGELFR